MQTLKKHLKWKVSKNSKNRKKNKKLQEKKNEADSEVGAVFGTTADTLKHYKENENEFAGNFNIFDNYKDSVYELRNKSKPLIRGDALKMTKTADA